MAKFVKGVSGNPKGRPRIPKMNNEKLRDLIREFVSGNLDIEKLQADFDLIEKPEVKFKIRMDLLKMLLPDPVNPEKLSEEAYQQVIEYFQNKLHEQTISKN